jgi:putative zinc finger/helix-turn-helix YgiT family protein
MSSNTCNHPHLLRKKIPDYSTDELGLPLRLLDAAEVDVCDACGKQFTVQIDNLDGVMAAAAIARATHSQKLSGREIRFLRKAMKMSAKELGEVLDSKPETVSRWEHSRLAMSSNSEKLLRLLVCTTLSSQAPAIGHVADEILQMRIPAVHDVQEDVRLCLQRVLCVTPPSKMPTAAYIKAVAGAHQRAA